MIISDKRFTFGLKPHIYHYDGRWMAMLCGNCLALNILALNHIKRVNTDALRLPQ